MRILFLLLFCLFLNADDSYFIPPKGWEAIQLKKPSPYVKIGFLGKGKADFRPSINLAVEEIEGSLKDYVKSVKEVHFDDSAMTCTDLGAFRMKGGKGHLLQLKNTSNWGDLIIFQAILVKNAKAYILTAATLKEELPKFQKTILQSLQSLDVVQDLALATKNESFQKLWASLESAKEKDASWESLKKEILAIDFLGPYWQILALEAGHKKIYSE